MKLYGKQIVITGGTSGIGLELVRKLAGANRVIVISKRRALPCDLLQGPYQVQLFHADLADRSAIELVVDQLQRQYSSIDMLINNAAIQCTPDFLSSHFNYDGIYSEIGVNFAAVCHLTYLLLPMLLATKEGAILNVNSGLAIAPKRSSAVYCATKSALDSLSRSLSYQLEDTSVNVHQVFLPLVETAMTKGRGAGKLDAEYVATKIINGVVQGKSVNDVGKVKLLRLMHYLMPVIARRIMRAG